MAKHFHLCWCVFMCFTHVTRHFLNSYLRIHLDEKPFGCHSSDKNFFLNSHVRLPSDRKPFGCHSCDEIFRTLVLLMWQFFSKLSCQNILKWKTIWLLLTWQHFLSELSCQNTSGLRNHLAATYVSRNFPNSHVKIHSNEKPLLST